MAMTRFFVIDAMTLKSSISTVPVWRWQLGFPNTYKRSAMRRAHA